MIASTRGADPAGPLTLATIQVKVSIPIHLKLINPSGDRIAATLITFTPDSLIIAPHDRAHVSRAVSAASFSMSRFSNAAGVSSCVGIVSRAVPSPRFASPLRSEIGNQSRYVSSPADALSLTGVCHRATLVTSQHFARNQWHMDCDPHHMRSPMRQQQHPSR